jgi:hypothetical protein
VKKQLSLIGSSIVPSRYRSAFAREHGLKILLIVRFAVALVLVAAPAYSASAAPGVPSITIYTNPGMQGQARTYNGPASAIPQPRVWGARSGSVRVYFGQWRVCQQPNYSGRCITLGPGQYPDIANYGFHGPVGSVSPIGSVAPGAGLRPPPRPPNYGGGVGTVILYEHENFQGQAFRVTHPIYDLSRNGFNDRASSIVVTGGRWQLCDQGNFGFPCHVFGPGQYPRLAYWGLNDKVSSLRPVAAGMADVATPAVRHYNVAWRPRNGGVPFTGKMDLKYSADGIVSGTYRADSIRPDPMNGKFTPVSGGRDGNHIHFRFLGMGMNLTFSGTIEHGNIVASSTSMRGRIYELEAKAFPPK